jgi:hypothetical protein
VLLTQLLLFCRFRFSGRSSRRSTSDDRVSRDRSRIFSATQDIALDAYRREILPDADLACFDSRAGISRLA